MQEGPLLWAAAAIAAPLQARLLTHFDPATAAGRLDKPEWLFKLVLQLVQVGGVAGVQGHPIMSPSYGPGDAASLRGSSSLLVAAAVRT